MDRTEARETVLTQAHERLGSEAAGLRLTRILGIGSIGTTYEASSEDGSRRAVKFFHRVLRGDTLLRYRWAAEHVARQQDLPQAFVQASQVQHSAQGDEFLVLERLQGESLEACLLRRSLGLPPLDALPLLEQLLQVLDALHSRKLCHGGLKVDDLFIETGGRLRLRTLGALGRDANENAFAVASRHDRFSAGVLGFVLLSGHRSLQHRSLLELGDSCQPGELPSLAQVVPGIFPPLSAYFDAWLGAEELSEFADAASILRDLQRVKQEYAASEQAVLRAVRTRL